MFNFLSFSFKIAKCQLKMVQFREAASHLAVTMKTTLKNLQNLPARRNRVALHVRKRSTIYLFTFKEKINKVF
jgi:hypothetical protein